MAHISTLVERFVRELEDVKRKYKIEARDLETIKFRLSCILEWLYYNPHEAEKEEIERLQEFLEKIKRVDTTKKLGGDNK